LHAWNTRVRKKKPKKKKKQKEKENETYFIPGKNTRELQLNKSKSGNILKPKNIHNLYRL